MFSKNMTTNMKQYGKTNRENTASKIKLSRLSKV